MQPTVTIEIPASSEAVVRQLPAYHEELQSPTLSAPHGTVIEACEHTLTDPNRCGCGGTDRLPTTPLDGSTDPATSLELPDHERREEEPNRGGCRRPVRRRLCVAVWRNARRHRRDAGSGTSRR